MIWGYLVFRKPPGSADHWLQHGESNLSLGDLRSDSNAGGTLGATPDGSRSWERLGNANMYIRLESY